MRPVLLAIDQGTTNTKAMLVAPDGRPVFRTSTPVELIRTEAGLLEQDATALWASVRDLGRTCAETARAQGLRVEGIAISNQRETALAWLNSGKPVANAISWQCQRSSCVCERLSAHAQTVRAKSGLQLGPLLTAGKWQWLLENSPELNTTIQSNELRFGTVDSWILWNLTGGRLHATDASNASRTGLLNLDSVDWDTELLSIFGIPRATLPVICSSSAKIGVCTSIEELAGVPIVAMVGDSHAALVGHGRYATGCTKATYGTGSSLMMLGDGVSQERGLARTIAWQVSRQTQYALEGNILMAGAALQWVGDFLGLQRPAEDAAALAETVSDAGGLVLVPAMVGLGAPYWDDAARGLIANVGRTHTAAHLARAAMEAIAYQVKDVFLAMQAAAAITIPELAADGGATRNQKLMQFQADLLDRPVQRSVCEDLSAVGAAWLGGLALGWWQSFEDLASLPGKTETFWPAMKPDLRNTLDGRWLAALEKTRLHTTSGEGR